MEIDYKEKWYTEMKPDYKQFDADSAYWDMKYRDRYSMMLEHVTDTPKILGIGCGLGRALSYFKKFGASVKGVEPSDYAIANSRLNSDEVIHSHFLGAQFQEKYDVIHIEQVLSHMPDYSHALNKAYSLLKDDGIIVVEEPNDFNALQKILEVKYGRYWVTEDHCNYFNYSSMSEVLDSIGFEVVHRYCTFPMEIFALAGANYFGNEELGREVHKSRHRTLSEVSFRERRLVLEGWASFDLGRDLVITARKKQTKT